jgi:myo-inositol-1(or 4)-monophosphatase
MELEKIFTQVHELTLETGKFLMDEINKVGKDDIEVKGLHNFVTYVDKESEQRLVNALTKILPEAGFIVEENTVSHKDEEYKWVIDPLDGTTNFIHSIPCFAISIALMHRDEVLLGIVYEINQKECFYAIKGSPAYMNGKEIKVSSTNKLSDALIATGFPYYDYGKLNQYMEVLKYFMRTTHGVRRLGSAATDLVYVACGRFEGFYEYGLSPWDVAAGAFIVQQAGGKVSDFRGGNDFIFGKEIIAANGNIYDDILRIINTSFL